MHQLVAPDAYTLNPGDLSWNALSSLGQLQIYDRSSDIQFLERGKEATILIINKLEVGKKQLETFKQLQCICVSATGYNNIDVEACAKYGVPVCNVVGYGSTSVAQHVFALLLNHTNQVALHSQGVHHGDWSRADDWCYWQTPLTELTGQVMGIYGLGKIGQQVAHIALAFGMKVIAHHKHPERDAMPGVRFVDFETLCRQSDVISLHAPLSAANKHIINATSLAMMKPTTLLINTGRGGLIDEAALAQALRQKIIAGAALDVLSQEPPAPNHVLLGVPNLTITPHHAWATKASRQRLLTAVANNVRAFIHGQPQSVVNPTYNQKI